MEIEQLVELYPRLYHMATAGSWPSIRDNGLWTTEQIVESANLGANEADALLSARRPRSVVVNHPVLGQASIRDQIPLKESFLAASLDDMSADDWRRTLNNRVFFWLHPDRLSGLLGARQYRSLEQDVLTVDTRSLLAAHGGRVRLSPMNSGSTLFPNPPRRGSGTFQTVASFDYESRKPGRALKDRIVELAVIDGVHDIAAHVVAVERRRGAAVLHEIPL